MAIGAARVQTFPLWPSLGTVCVVVASAFLAAILAGVPTVIVLGPARNPGDAAANVIESAFYLGAAAALIPLLERLSHRSLAGLGVRPLTVRQWGFAAAGLVLILVMQMIYQLILTLVHQQNHIQAGFQNFRVTSPEAAALVLINGAIIAPIVEELFFRGFVFNALAAHTSFWPAAILGGAFFGIAHGDPILFPVLALFGAMQAAFYRMTGNLVVPMIVHAANNAIFLSLMMAIPGFH